MNGAEKSDSPIVARKAANGAGEPAEERVEPGSRITGERRIRVDACVIGTGAGGAPVAKELAEGGMSVAMLEDGGRFTADDLTARPREMTTKLYRDAAEILQVPEKTVKSRLFTARHLLRDALTARGITR